MCLGIPGKVVDVFRQDDLSMGKVDFGGVVKRICLEYLPTIAVGEYVLVHVGFAIARVNETEAQQIFQFLAQMNELEELGAEAASPVEPVPEPASVDTGGPA